MSCAVRAGIGFGERPDCETTTLRLAGKGVAQQTQRPYSQVDGESAIQSAVRILHKLLPGIQVFNRNFIFLSFLPSPRLGFRAGLFGEKTYTVQVFSLAGGRQGQLNG